MRNEAYIGRFSPQLASSKAEESTKVTSVYLPAAAHF